LQTGDELFLKDNIIPQELNARATISTTEEITIYHGDNLILDESIVATESFIEDATISQESLSVFMTIDHVLLDETILSQNENMNFSDIMQSSVEEHNDYKNNIDIKDIVEDQNSEIKISLQDTSRITLSQSEWTKQDSQIMDNGHSYDVYSKGSESTDISILIEDGIAIFDNHG
jgi:hypothetical protein